MNQEEICFLPASDLVQLYRTGALSPAEVTTTVLERMEKLNPVLNAFITPTPELAMQQAKQAETAYRSGTAAPLAGVPVSIKDLAVTRGIRTTRGSLLYENWIPDFDSPLSERLFGAGAVILGKTSTPELGWKGETTNRITGSTHNPWQHGRTPGGSSGGGAAAVAAGIGPIAQGSDGAGSIRIPCGFCGIYGLKPSAGLIPYYPLGVMGDLSHAGPMTRTVLDAALFLDVTAGADARDRLTWSSGINYVDSLSSLDLRGRRIAWSRDLGYAAIDPEVADIAASAARVFENLGAHVEEVNPGLPDPWPIVNTIWEAGMSGAFRDNLEQARDKLDPGLLEIVERGRTVLAADLVAAQLKRNDYCEAMRQFMAGFDLLLTPTLPCTAFPVGQDHPGMVNGQPVTYLGWTAFTYPFNLTGQPAATVPAGFTADGLPVGLQIVGRWHDDVSVLRASAAFEAARPWTGAQPKLAPA